jgi:rubredoxin
MSWIEGVLDYSKSELELIGFDKSDLSDVMLETIQKLYRSVGNQPNAMKSVLKMMIDLVDKKPISVITENDFDENGRCTRCEYIYRAKDGKYYNDRAVVFKRSWEDPSEHYLYQGNARSKQEITLPYILRQGVHLFP